MGEAGEADLAEGEHCFTARLGRGDVLLHVSQLKQFLCGLERLRGIKGPCRKVEACPNGGGT